MTPDDLQAWLRANTDHIFGFTDYEVALGSVEDLHGMLGDWFRDETWNTPGYRFVPLGQDGTGGAVALWFRPGVEGPPPVVFFGSEGGCGVLAASPENWAKVLAHGPRIVEYADPDTATSALSREANWVLASDAEPERRDRARAHLEAYRRAVLERFGSLESFDHLAAVSAADQHELRTWVEGVVERASARETEAVREAHREARRKAETYAGASAQLAPDRADGSKYQGRCPACGALGDLRLTRYEELSFGICFACYFSSAW